MNLLAGGGQEEVVEEVVETTVPTATPLVSTNSGLVESAASSSWLGWGVGILLVLIVAYLIYRIIKRKRG